MHARAETSMASAFVMNGTSVTWLLDRAGRTVWSTPTDSETFAHMGVIEGVEHMLVRVHADDRARARAWWHEALESDRPAAATMRVTAADGGWLTLDVEARDLGQGDGILVTVLDVTRRARAERWLTACNALLGDMARGVPAEDLLERLVQVVEAEIHDSRCTVMLTTPDRHNLVMGAAPAFPASYVNAVDGLPAGPAMGSCGSAAWSGHTVVVPDVRTDQRWAEFQDLARDHDIVACWSTPFVGGDRADVLGTFAIYCDHRRMPLPEELNLLHDAGRVAALVCQARASRDALRTIALTDELTGLGNRNACLALLRDARSNAARLDRPYAVVSIDLDEFSMVNDSLGHAAGDELLRVVAERLVKATGTRGDVVRPGGDEFVVVTGPLDDRRQAQDLVCDLHRGLADAIDVFGYQTHVRISTGLAVMDPGSRVEPLGAAVLAMTVAGNSGGGQTAVYTPQMQAESDDYFVLATDLRRAVATGELTVAYEPVVDLVSRQVVRLEALSRWTHPTRGAVSPGRFIPVAERSGLIVDLGAQVLRRSCAHLAALRRAGHDLGMSVNVSVRQLLDPGLVEVVAEALRATGLPADTLTLELTESVVIEEDQRAHECLAALHELGVRISVDDFGTGYSSLSYLRRFRFDELKLDHAFIAEVATEQRVRSMVASVVRLGHELGIPVVAEGVETEAQAQALVTMGCPLAQGWLFSGLTPPG